MPDNGSPKPKKPLRISRKVQEVIARARELNLAMPGAPPKKLAENVIRAVGESTFKSPAQVDLFCSLVLESDRGLVLVAAAIIDNELELLLREFFIWRSGASKAESDFFFKGPMPPLRSTALRIRLAFLLGLISPTVKKALTELQNFRSTVAAHSRDQLILTSKHASGILECLSVITPISAAVAAAKKYVDVLVISDGLPGDPKGLTPKVGFATATIVLLMALADARKGAMRGRRYEND
jgi:hypothetical protein